MSRRDVKVLAGVVLGLISVGAVAGLLWWWVAPQPTYRVAEDGLFFVDPQPEAYIAAEGWFVVVTGVIGLAAGVLVWLRYRAAAPWGSLLGLFVGGLAGAAATAGVGMLLGRSDPWAGAVGSITQGSLEIRAWGVLVVEAGLAVAGWLLLDILVLPPAETIAADPSYLTGEPSGGVSARDV